MEPVSNATAIQSTTALSVQQKSSSWKTSTLAKQPVLTITSSMAPTASSVTAHALHVMAPMPLTA